MIDHRLSRQNVKLFLREPLGERLSRRYVMRRKLDNLFSRRDFWKVAGVGSLAGSQLMGKPLQSESHHRVQDGNLLVLQRGRVKGGGLGAECRFFSPLLQRPDTAG